MVATTSRIDSTNQFIYEYYYDVSAVLLKTYALLQLSYMFLTVYGHYDYSPQAQEVRFRFNQRMSTMQMRVVELLADSRTDVWMCDPDVYHKLGCFFFVLTLQNFPTQRSNQFLGHTDNQITRFVQGYMDNEANFNEKNSCRQTCADYTLTKNHNCFNGSYCSQAAVGEEQNKHRCMGTVVNCTFIESHVNVCPAVSHFLVLYPNVRHCMYTEDHKHPILRKSRTVSLSSSIK